MHQNSLSFAIIGTGALGGYYGARLHHAGFPTHFLLHSDFAHVKSHGLKVESIHGDFSIAHPQIYPNMDALPPCDVLCLSLKSTANAQCLPFLRSKLKPGGCVLVLQNGIGIEEEIADHVGDAAVIGGLCFLCSHKIGPGHIQHLDYGSIILAPLAAHSAQSEPLLQRIREALVHAGIDATINPNLGAARWQKLMWNIPFNGLSVVLRCTTLELMQSEAGTRLVRTLMEEVEAASIACGTPVPPNLIDKLLHTTRKMTPYLPSMRLDFERNQAMEIDAIYSRPLARASAHGLSMPRTAMLRDQLVMLEQGLFQA